MISIPGMLLSSCLEIISYIFGHPFNSGGIFLERVTAYLLLNFLNSEVLGFGLITRQI